MPSKVSHSYAFRGSVKPLIGNIIGDMFDEIAQTYPKKDATVSLPQGIRYMYSQLQSEVNNADKGFVGLGLKKGDRLAIWATKIAEWVVARFARLRWQ
jgi:fatty-acyl-CoA synthase